MRILPLLAVVGTLGASVAVIGFACVDRLAHPVAGPVVAVAARPMPPEPATTGAIPSPAPVAKPPSGFDTERLNALMRGDPIAGPGRR